MSGPSLKVNYTEFQIIPWSKTEAAPPRSDLSSFTDKALIGSADQLQLESRATSPRRSHRNPQRSH